MTTTLGSKITTILRGVTFESMKLSTSLAIELRGDECPIKLTDLLTAKCDEIMIIINQHIKDDYIPAAQLDHYALTWEFYKTSYDNYWQTITPLGRILIKYDHVKGVYTILYPFHFGRYKCRRYDNLEYIQKHCQRVINLELKKLIKAVTDANKLQ